MMFVRPTGARPVLRTLLFASAAGLAIGSAVLAVSAHAAPITAVSDKPVFASNRLSVEVIGQGSDVILIPGFSCSREVWRAEAERLQATHRVHMVQLAGFAGEPWVHGDGAFVQPVIDELARYIRDQGLSAPAVIGHSMGGMSAVMLAQQHPDLVGRVMSVDSLPFFSALYGPQVTVETARPYAEQTAAGILASDDASFRIGQEQTAIALAKDEAVRAAMVEWGVASDRQALASAMHDVMLTDLRPGLAAMTTPVWAVYASDANGGAPAAMADAMWGGEYASLPGVTLIRVDDSRHFIMSDQPERMALIIDEFLAE